MRAYLVGRTNGVAAIVTGSKFVSRSHVQIACTTVGYCSEVCPKGVDPANAVNQNKTASAMDFFLRFVAPKGSAK